LEPGFEFSPTEHLTIIAITALTEMERSNRISEFILSKMGDPSAVASCSKLRQIKRWLRKNLLLLVTISGVFFGVVLGEYLPLIFLI
jgi:hypothetical protein